MTKPSVRAEVLGSLLQPTRLLELRAASAEGKASAEELHAAEDAAVLAAIELQEAVGVDVISDGEMRRPSWSLTRGMFEGTEQRPGSSSFPASVRGFRNSANAPGRGRGGAQVIVNKMKPVADRHPGQEYPFLHDHAHAMTKYTMAAPSYHRRYWSDEFSSQGDYSSCEEFLTDVRDWLHGISEWLIEQGCPYIQLDAPSYGSMCDPENRAWHESQGHDLDKIVAFDAALDSSVFEGLDVVSALHVCRGNGGGGGWHSAGGYAPIAEPLFSNLDIDVVLLEYDSDRAGDFGPIAKVKSGTTAVLGLLSTKTAELEDEAVIKGRIEEAASLKPLEELALSTQCGFASASNAPMTPEEQRAKLELVTKVARDVWGPAAS